MDMSEYQPTPPCKILCPVGPSSIRCTISTTMVGVRCEIVNGSPAGTFL